MKDTDSHDQKHFLCQRDLWRATGWGGGHYQWRTSNDAPRYHFKAVLAGIFIVTEKGKVSWPNWFERCWVKWNETGYSFAELHKAVLISPVDLRCISMWFDSGNHTLKYFWKRCSNSQMANCLGSDIFVCLVGTWGRVGLNMCVFVCVSWTSSQRPPPFQKYPRISLCAKTGGLIYTQHLCMITTCTRIFAKH